ncbi:MAG: hypothetical protein ABIQ82_15710 [Variovorax sp.]
MNALTREDVDLLLMIGAAVVVFLAHVAALVAVLRGRVLRRVRGQPGVASLSQPASQPPPRP